MSNFDDADCDLLIDRLVGPLSPPDRVAFRRAAEDAIARSPCAGEAAVCRAVADLLWAFWGHPVPDPASVLRQFWPAYLRSSRAGVTNA
jgi:hypothetical protein